MEKQKKDFDEIFLEYQKSEGGKLCEDIYKLLKNPSEKHAVKDEKTDSNPVLETKYILELICVISYSKEGLYQ